MFYYYLFSSIAYGEPICWEVEGHNLLTSKGYGFHRGNRILYLVMEFKYPSRVTFGNASKEEFEKHTEHCISLKFKSSDGLFLLLSEIAASP